MMSLEVRNRAIFAINVPNNQLLTSSDKILSKSKTTPLSRAKENSTLVLPLDYMPSTWTVLCGRGKDYFNSSKCDRCSPERKNW